MGSIPKQVVMTKKANSIPLRGPNSHSLPSLSETLPIVRDVRKQLERCVADLEHVERKCVPAQTPLDGESVAVSMVTIRMLAACLSELLKLERPQDHREYCPDLCRLLDCPQQLVLRRAVEHAILVLQQTRSKFKSKDLAGLRVSLEILLENSKNSTHTS